MKGSLSKDFWISAVVAEVVEFTIVVAAGLAFTAGGADPVGCELLVVGVDIAGAEAALLAAAAALVLAFFLLDILFMMYC
jgi:hypothetical protein